MDNIIKQVQEACAEKCEKQAEEYGGQEYYAIGCADAAAAIRALDLSHLTGWQDISTAPKDGTALLLWNGECMVTGKYVVSKNAYGYGYDSERWELLDGSDSCGDSWIFPEPIVWYPLPPAPKEK